jgi:arylsulfatase A-like enzyme
MSKKPNVILVITDDQGYPPMGCYGHPFINTPHIDEFYNQSIRFEQFHSGTTCAPTRAGMMTGHNCNSTGVWHTIGGRSLLRKDEWTLAEALKGGGYITGMFGKWHLGDTYPLRPMDRGFDQVVCHGGGGISQQPDWWGNDYFDDTYWVNGEPESFKGYCTDVFFEEAIKFMEEKKDEPFFCYLSTNAPHSPFNVAKKYWEQYKDKTDSEKYARFLGMISNIDENFGILRDKLKEWEIEDNTILIFMSDNGQTGVGEPVSNQYNHTLRGFKGSEYEGGHRIPFFIRWPDGNISGGKSLDELTAYIDIMPTLLDLCGVEVPPERTFHGISFAPLLKGQKDQIWQERFLATDTQRISHPIKWRKSCVMHQNWRLVNRHELYDIESDPSQETNLAADHGELVKKMQEAYEDWWTLCADQFDSDVPISIGSEKEKRVKICTHDLRNEQDAGVVWNQAQVRRGETCVGYWAIEAEEEGTYQFELARWPEEAKHPIQAGIKGDDIVWDKENTASGSEVFYTGGKALPLKDATLAIEGLPRLSVEVKENDQYARFTVKLKKGEYRLRAFFTDLEGLLTSAYYVYALKIA